MNLGENSDILEVGLILLDGDLFPQISNLSLKLVRGHFKSIFFKFILSLFLSRHKHRIVICSFTPCNNVECYIWKNPQAFQNLRVTEQLRRRYQSYLLKAIETITVWLSFQILPRLTWQRKKWEEMIWRGSYPLFCSTICNHSLNTFVVNIWAGT